MYVLEVNWIIQARLLFRDVSDSSVIFVKIELLNSNVFALLKHILMVVILEYI